MGLGDSGQQLEILHIEDARRADTGEDGLHRPSGAMNIEANIGQPRDDLLYLLFSSVLLIATIMLESPS